MLLVGGGRVLVDSGLPLKGVSKLITPEHFSVANAVGAALGTVAGTSESVESLAAIIASLGQQGGVQSEEEQQHRAREVAIQQGKARAVAEAVRKGKLCSSCWTRLESKHVIHWQHVLYSGKLIFHLVQNFVTFVVWQLVTKLKPTKIRIVDNDE